MPRSISFYVYSFSKFKKIKFKIRFMDKRARIGTFRVEKVFIAGIKAGVLGDKRETAILLGSTFANVNCLYLLFKN